MKAILVLSMILALGSCDIHRMWTEGDQHGPGDYHIDFVGTGVVSGYVDGEPNMAGLPKWRINIGPADVDGVATVARIPDTASTYRVGVTEGQVDIRVRRGSKVIREHTNVSAMVTGRFR